MKQAASSRSGRAAAAPHLALIAVQILFGTWPIIGKVALRALPASILVAFRTTGAAIAFIILGRTLGRLRIENRRDYAMLALCSVLGVSLNQFLYVKGLSLSTAINATLLSTAIPIFALIVSVVLGYDYFSWRKACGVILAACGVIYLVNPSRADFNGSKTLGNLLIVTSSLCYGSYIAISKNLVRRYGALTVITWVFIFGSAASIPSGVYEMILTPLHSISTGIWLAVLYIIIAPTVGAYYLNAWSLARVPPSTVAVYIYLQPLIAFALAPLILNESWNDHTLIATVLIFTGVAIVTIRQRNRDLAEISGHPNV
jgi:drug/metabolite transporter (DMT)-like permease